MRRFISAFAAVLALASACFAGHVDAVVTDKGLTYVLEHEGLRVVDPRTGGITNLADPRRNLNEYSSSGLQALALTPSGSPAVLWSGMHKTRGPETFVNSVRLSRWFGAARAVSIAPNGDIYVFGLFESKAPKLVHRFRADGTLLDSFLDHLTTDWEDVPLSLSTARLAATSDGVYVLMPFLNSAQVSKFSPGKPSEVLRIKEGRIATLFKQRGKVYAQIDLGTPLRADIREIARGDLDNAVTVHSGGPAGPSIGLSPTGAVVERNASIGAKRDSISVRH